MPQRNKPNACNIAGDKIIEVRSNGRKVRSNGMEVRSSGTRFRSNGMQVVIRMPLHSNHMIFLVQFGINKHL